MNEEANVYESHYWLKESKLKAEEFKQFEASQRSLKIDFFFFYVVGNWTQGLHAY